MLLASGLSLAAALGAPQNPLLNALAEYQSGDKGSPGNPLAKVGYDLANVYANAQATALGVSAAVVGVPLTADVSSMQINQAQNSVLINASSVAADPSQLIADLDNLGFQSTGVYSRMVSGWLAVDQIANLSVLPELLTASAAVSPVVDTGSVDSQGDVVMQANVARATYGVTGAGIKVGVLSDSFNDLGGYATDVSTGDLPANVQIVQDWTGGTDEGRAMSQIVYDIAPGSSLAFATAEYGQAGEAANIEALAALGCKVICDDAGWLGEPFFQNGVIAQAIEGVVAQGIPYFTSAGNDAQQSYQTAFVPGGTYTAGQFSSSTGAPYFYGGVAHNFNPGGAESDFQSFTLAPNAEVRLELQWDQPFASVDGMGADNDVDVYMLNAAKTQVVAGSAGNTVGGDPSQWFSYTNTTGTTQTYNLMIVNSSGPAPGFIKYINSTDGWPGMTNVAYATNSGTTFGHFNSTSVGTAGAANYAKTPAYGVSPAVLESYSSYGGTPMFFADNGTRLATPITPNKPNFVAPDAVDTTVPGFSYFTGTSAASPHAAGVAALMLQLNSSLTPAEIYTDMAATALPMSAPFNSGYNYASGAGLIQAPGALQLASGLMVLSSTPAAGSVVFTPPTSFVTTFSTAVDPTSLQADALTVNGIAANSVSLSANDLTATFSYTTSPVTAQGLETMAMAAGAATELGNSTAGLSAFNAAFRYDALLQQVTTTAPAVGGAFTLTGASLTYDMSFNEPVNPASVSTSSLSLSGISGAYVASDTVLPGDTTVQFSIAGMSTEGTLTAGIAAGAVTDAYGNPCAAFSGSYSVDVGTMPFPTTLTANSPLGSLVYTGSYSGAGISPASDTDSYTLALDAGEVLSASLTPVAGLQPVLALTGPGGTTLGTATATAAGQQALLQTMAAAAAGTYTLTVSSVGGTSGNYTLGVDLNAALGAGNGTTTAIDGSYVSLPSQTGRYAVVGDADPTLPATSRQITTAYNGDWYGGNGNMFDVTTFGNPITITSLDVNIAAGTYTMLLYIKAGTYVGSETNSAAWTEVASDTVVSTSSGAPTLFSVPNVQLAAASLTGFYVTSTNGAMSYSAGDATYSNADLSLSLGNALMYPFTGVADSRIWNGTINYIVGSGSGTPEVDKYTVNLTGQTGHRLDVVLAGQGVSFAGEQLLLLGTDGTTVLATASATPLGAGVSATNYDLGILNFPVPADGTYTLRLTSTLTQGAYVLAVTDNLAFDTDPSNTLSDTLRSLDQTPQALGYLSSTGTDMYAVDLAAGQQLTATTATPFDTAGSLPDDTLVPQLTLYNPAGNQVATGSASLQFTPTAAGTYHVAVSAASGTGQYVLGLQMPAAGNVPDALTLAPGGTITYGGTLNLSATLLASGVPLASEPISFTVHNLYVGTALTNANGVAALVGVSSIGCGAGLDAAYLAADFAGDSTYMASSGTADVNVNKAPLTVTAGNATRVYNAPDPAYTATYSGFVNSETLAISGVTGTPALVSNDSNSSPVGNYAITAGPGTLVAANYAFSFGDGTLSITAASTTTLLLSISTPLTTAGQATTLAATVSAVSPSTATPGAGNVTFYDNGTAVGSAPVSAGMATLVATALPGGRGTITASYGGDGLNFLASASSSAAAIITTAAAAGDGTAGYGGDGGPASAALLNQPVAAVVDAAGDVFIADWSNQRVREINHATGVITTVAGTGTAGFSGDGGAATAAKLNAPRALALDSAGNLYIADANNERIRKVNLSTGIITTIAGTGASGYGGDGGPATAAEFLTPVGLAVDAADDVFVADDYNYRVREIVASTGDTITVAGTGTSGYSGDGGQATAAMIENCYGLAVDASGNLYIADTWDYRVRKVNLASGVITTFAGNGNGAFSGDGGQATAAGIGEPTGMAFDAAGNNLYITDIYNSRVREVNLASGAISSVAGTGTAAFSGDGGSPTLASLNTPHGVAVDATGDVFIADTGNNRVREIAAPDGVFVGGPSALSVSATATYGAKLTLAATLLVGGMPVPDGTVNFSFFGASLGSAVTNAAGVASLGGVSVAGYNAGTYKSCVTASFAGFWTLQASGTVADLSVTAAPTATSVSAAPNTIILGQSATLSATVTALASSTATPTGGSVTFYENGTALGSATLSGGAATFVMTPLSLGANQAITASYGGDGLNFLGSTAAPGSSVVMSTAAGGATTTSLNYPYGVAVDAAADIFIADTSNNCIREINHATGLMTIVAGTGIHGYSGDGGPATAARLANPLAVAVDAAGNLYIADSSNNRIREVHAGTGIITTFAGAGAAGYSGDGGPAVSAMINGPDGMALDTAGDIYFADTNNNRVREVLANGTIITVAGTGAAGYDGDGMAGTAAQLNVPNAVALDASGDLYIADTSNHRIRELNAAGVITTVVGTGTSGNGGNGGPATAAQMSYPRGLAVNAAGDLFFSDSSYSVIREVNPAGIISAYAGSGVGGYGGDGGLATAALLYNPEGIALDAAGNLYFVDYYDQCLRCVSTSGIINSVVGGIGDGRAASAAILANPYGTAVDSSGNIYIADTANQRIREINAVTGLVTTLAGTGMSGFRGDGGAANLARLASPQGVAVDAAGDVYVADTANQRIRKINATTGVITTIAGNGTAGYTGNGGPATAAELNSPEGLAVDSAGDIFIADTDNQCIREVLAGSRVIITVAGTGTAGYNGDGLAGTAAQLNNPVAVALDASGDLYIADSSNDRVRELTPAGMISTVAGTGTAGYAGDDGAATAALIGSVSGLIVDASGNLFLSDSTYACVRRVSAAGVITTFAGNGTAGFSGDGGPATAASLTSPQGLTLDACGDLYIVDNGNNRLREVRNSALVTVISASWVDVVAPATATYGGTLTVSATLLFDTAPVPGETVTFSLHGTSLGTAVTNAQGVATLSGLSLAGYRAATYSSYLTASFAGDANYHSCWTTVDLVVAKAPLIVTAVNASRAYGAANPAYSVTFGGWVNGDTAADAVGGSAAFTSSAQANSPVGNYTLTASQGTLAAANYTFSFANATLTVTPAALLVTANNVSRVYGAADPTFTATYSGWVNGDTLGNAVSGSLAFSSSDTANSPVGNYTITPAQGTLAAANYTFSFANATLSITPASTASDLSVSPTAIAYGQTTTLSATVAVMAPSMACVSGGNVTFYDNGNAIGSAAVSGGTATLTTSSLAAGSHALTVVYGGQLNFLGSGTANGSAWTITTAAGGGSGGNGGPATAAALSNPRSEAVDAAGNIFIADCYDQVVREVNHLTGIINTVAGGGTTLGDGGPATAAMLSDPQAVALDSSGNLYIADTGDYRVRKVNLTTGKISTIAGTGTWGYSGDGGAATAATLNAPIALAVDAAGDVFIADFYNSRIREVNAATGKISSVAGTGANGYNGDGMAGTAAELWYPTGVAVDSSGNIYIADAYNSRIRKVSATGIISTVAGNGTMGFSGDGGAATAAAIDLPWGVALDTAGDLFISDNSDSRIREVNTAGVITTIAGSGTAGFSGDSGPALAAMLSNPRGLALDSSGDLFVADANNNRIREMVIRNAIVTVSIAATTLAFGSSATATYGGTLSLSATLLAGAAPVSGETITFSLHGSSVGTAVTAANGVATLGNLTLAAYGAGNYAAYIGASFAGDANCSASSTVGNLVVNKAPLLVTAANASRTYGAADPSYSATYSGLINGDMLGNAVSGNPALTSNDTSTSPAGTYTIAAGLGTLAAQNYTFAFVNGTLTVYSVIAGHDLFYANSSYNGHSDTASAADDNAIDTSKSALLPGQTATYANYTDSTQGINGIMVDVAGLANPAGLTAADFQFLVGDDSTPGDWTTPATSPTVAVRVGAGTDSSDRVELIWPDGTIHNQWLQVTVLADANTGLAANDVFYFGSEPGAVQGAGYASFDDIFAVYRAIGNTPIVTAATAADVNHDGMVTFDDIFAVYRAIGGAQLSMINAPAVPAATAAATDAVTSEASAATNVMADQVPTIASDTNRAASLPPVNPGQSASTDSLAVVAAGPAPIPGMTSPDLPSATAVSTIVPPIPVVAAIPATSGQPADLLPAAAFVGPTIAPTRVLPVMIVNTASDPSSVSEGASVALAATMRPAVAAATGVAARYPSRDLWALDFALTNTSQWAYRTAAAGNDDPASALLSWGGTGGDGFPPDGALGDWLFDRSVTSALLPI